MKAKIQGIDKLFGDPISYRIPQFQRPYAWSEKQWQPLWEDARKMADRILDQEKDLIPHFMGSIVLQPMKSADGKISRVLVVDGQQRLTTLQLLLKATQNAFQESLNNPRKFKNLDKLLLNDPKRTGNDPYNETKIRQTNRSDQSDFQGVMRDRIAPGQPRAIIKAYDYFHEQVYEWVNRHANVDARATALYDTLVKQLKVVSIILDTREERHVIFEILNARGEPLKQADLIKSMIMYKANVDDDDQKARELWGMFEDDWWWEEDGRGRDPQIRIDRFLNYWIMMYISEYVTFDHTAAEFRNYIEGFKPDIEKVAQDIREAGLIYFGIEENCLHILFDKADNFDKDDKKKLRKFIEHIKAMEIGVIMPPLLWLYTKRFYTNDVSEKELQRSARALESYLVRRMLCKKEAANLNKIFLGMVKLLKKKKDQPVDNVVVQFLEDQSAESGIWPDDYTVIAKITTFPMPGNASRKKMIFEAIETHLGSNLIDTSKLTVEHILPKNWANGDWPFPKDTVDEVAAAALRNDYIKFIGNFTLATKELNSSRSNNNQSWEHKKKALNNFDELYLNQELLENAPEVWDEKAIEKRSEQLAQAIVQIWPHADGI